MLKLMATDAYVFDAKLETAKTSGKQYLSVTASGKTGVKLGENQWSDDITIHFNVFDDGIKKFCDQNGNLVIGKGSRINVDGRGYLRVWTDQNGQIQFTKDGKVGMTFEMQYPDVELVKDHSQNNGQAAQPAQAQYAPAPQQPQYQQAPAPQQPQYRQQVPQQAPAPQQPQYRQQAPAQPQYQPAPQQAPAQYQQAPAQQAPTAQQGFMNVPTGVGETLPWA